ncbi:hypothetical protein VNI00_012576 [Paramarasmius palmivorus]|uniref:Uncharacterized protein n=1 Tax=Paramarasmius palmivorus TaxID=297713 RepID=A0AAW0C3U5_9AGAR
MEGYDEEKAKTELQLWIKERSNAEHSKANICTLLQDTTAVHSLVCGSPCAWRLVSSINEPEEVVFKLQGIIIASELPPFVKAPGRRTITGVLRQGVTLTGFGIPEFDNAVSGIKIGDLLLKRNVPIQGLETLNCIGEFHGSQTLHISNRYFTPRRIAGGEAAVEISQEVDPHGILRRTPQQDFIHTRENVVEYERCRSEEKRNLHFEPVSPAIFRVGDLVEVQLTLMMVNPGRSLYKTVPILRSVTLLDDHFSKQVELHALCKSSSRRGPLILKSTAFLKRKAGNWDETEGTTTKQLRKMDIAADT